MSTVRPQSDIVPEYVTRMEKVPAPYQHPTSVYGVEGLSRAMIAWMLDINVRASIKRREFDRTLIRICLYIKHMERIMTQNGILFEQYTGKIGGELVQNARLNFQDDMVATMVTGGPVPIAGHIHSVNELCGSVSDAQTMELKLHQLEIIRYMDRADPLSLEEFNASRREDRPQSPPYN